MDKVKGHQGLYKSGAAIVNKNQKEYEMAIKRKQREREYNEMKNNVNALKSQVDSLDDKLNSILDLLSRK